MAEHGFSPPDDSKKSFKSQLMNSAAPLPEQVHSNPFAETETPPPDPSSGGDAALEGAKQKLADAQEAARTSLEAREASFEKLRNLDRIREDARRAMSGKPPVTDEEWRQTAREDSEEEPVDTDVHAENVGRFRLFIRGAVEKLGGAKEAAGKGYEASAGYLAARAAALGETAKELGPQAEKVARKLGAEYNKLNWKQKIAVGVGLAGVAAVGTALTGGGGLIWSLGATGWWRVLAGSGAFVGLEGYLQHKKETTGDRWWNKHPKAYAATAGIIVGGASLAIHGGEAIAHSQWLADMFGYGAGASGSGADAPLAAHAGHEAISKVEVMPAHALPQPEAVHAQTIEPVSEAPPAPEAVSLAAEATAGRGYEQGLWDLWHQMHDPATHFALPAGIDPQSDLARLYGADQHSIHRVLYELATKHGFLHADGSSVAVDPRAHFSFANGEVHLSDPTHPDMVEAPEGAHTTPAYHPEHAQLDEVRARLGITEEAQTAELNRMSFEAHQAIDHPAPAPAVGPETAPAVEVPPPAPHEIVSPQGAEPAPSAHLEVNAHNLAVDTSGAHQYLARDGAKVVFGGNSEERAARAAAWVARDHAAVVYFDRETKDLFGLRTHHHLVRMTWRALSGNEIGPLGEPAAPLTVEQPYLEEVLPAPGHLAHVPSIDDLQAQVPDAP